MSGAQVDSNKKEIEAGEVSEANVNIRTFRKLADVENFYRFIFDNNLRAEARVMIEALFTHLGGKKTKRKRRKKNVQ